MWPGDRRRSEGHEPLERRGQFALRVPAVDRLQAEPAGIAPLLEDAERGCDIDIATIERHRPAMAGAESAR